MLVLLYIFTETLTSSLLCTMQKICYELTEKLPLAMYSFGRRDSPCFSKGQVTPGNTYVAFLQEHETEENSLAVLWGRKLIYIYFFLTGGALSLTF